VLDPDRGGAFGARGEQELRDVGDVLGTTQPAKR